ncbi:peptidase [Virgibacillus phasianinus]|uniref:Peptidase n=1 Tax=Virgibacillus phasianinus TaxID=2017483 RepID=A0A220U2D9_9BACI|nr:C40 family peptidase [Virgibacillus phasianinus]ASK62096.1 peptidase [Virgibacillus phasianinus]
MINQTLDKNTVWVVSVQVATVWTSKESARTIDALGITNPTDIDRWIAELTTEQKTALCTENRVQSQLLYGEFVQVTEVEGEWAHVIIPSQPSKKDPRGYPGLVSLTQLKRLDKENWNQPETAAINAKKAWLTATNGEKVMELSYMTCLPVLRKHSNMVEVLTPHGPMFLSNQALHIYETSQGLEKKSGDAIVAAGEPFLDLAYFWGGMSSFGYDCSGFSYATHKACGYQIPRDASDQARAGNHVTNEDLLPGDLLFFAYEEGKGSLHHVGIYYGEGKMIHSRTNGKSVEIIQLKGTIYEKELCGARRYWEE